MGEWFILSNGGIYEHYGSFETKEECEQKCKELMEQMHFVNVFFMPVQKEDEIIKKDEEQ